MHSVFVQKKEKRNQIKKIILTKRVTCVWMATQVLPLRNGNTIKKRNMFWNFFTKISTEKWRGRRNIMLHEHMNLINENGERKGYSVFIKKSQILFLTVFSKFCTHILHTFMKTFDLLNLNLDLNISFTLFLNKRKKNALFLWMKFYLRRSIQF